MNLNMTSIWDALAKELDLAASPEEFHRFLYENFNISLEEALEFIHPVAFYAIDKYFLQKPRLIKRPKKDAQMQNALASLFLHGIVFGLYVAEKLK